MNRYLLLCGAIAVAIGGTLTLRLRYVTGPTTVRASGVSISRTVPSEYLTPLSAFNLRFTETQVAPGEHPVLPGGAAGITDEEAVTKAMAQSLGAVDGQLSPGVQVAARFGAFSDDVFAKGGPGAPMQLLYQNRPAWIVTFFGPGLTIPLDGPDPLAVHHEQNVVIDADTGDYLMGYS